MRQGEFIKEFGIGAGQVDGDGASRLIRDDAAIQRATGGILQAFVGADDDGIEAARRGAGDLEDALERGDNVLGRKVGTI